MSISFYNKDILNTFVEFLYKSSELRFVVVDNLIYKNRDNEWSDEVSDQEIFEDFKSDLKIHPNIDRCTDYCTCNYSKDKEDDQKDEEIDDENHDNHNYIETKSKIDYYIKKEIDELIVNEFIDNGSCKNHIDAFEKILLNDNYEIFPKDKKVIFENIRGFNYDHRGSDHTFIKLDYFDKYQLPDNTLKSFLEGLYKIKSHKFDKWYELFCKIKSLTQKGNQIIIQFNFDHGS